MKDCITVVGAVNVDIGGFPKQPLLDGDSNPGKVTMSMGGVGRNIAHNLCLMGLPVQLATVLGNDSNGAMVWSSCESIGMEMSLTNTVFGRRTSTYLYIADDKNDMRLAISDMDIYDAITPRFLQSRMNRINQGRAVVVDTNIPEESILYLAQNTKVPVIADAVSGAKAQRLLKALPYLTCVKPNALEAQVLTGIDTSTVEGAQASAEKLADMGVKYAIVSMGKRGVCCAGAEGSFFVPASQGKVVNTTGAGDAFTAGLCLGMLQGRGMRECIQLGQAASLITLESTDTVNPDMTLSRLIGRFEEIRFAK